MAEAGIQWEHSHDFSTNSESRKRSVTVVFGLTTIIMFLEIGVGTWSGSMALLADGWHMGTHSAAFAIAIFAYAYAKKHAVSKEFSFGTGKVSYLGGFASAVALAIVALMMAIESIQRLIEPQAIYFTEAIAVAFVGFAVNIASVYLLHDGHYSHDSHHDHGHEEHHDHNLKAAYFHVLADTLTSVLAIMALLTGKYFGWFWMDALMGIVGAAVISRWSYGLIKESSSVLLDKSVGPIAEIVETFKADRETVINDLHIWNIAPGHQAVILSVATTGSKSPTEYKNILKKHLPQLSHATIEVKESAASLVGEREGS